MEVIAAVLILVFTLSGCAKVNVPKLPWAAKKDSEPAVTANSGSKDQAADSGKSPLETLREAADLLSDDTRVIIRAGHDERELFRIETISCTTPEYLTCLAGLRQEYENGLSAGLWDGESGQALAESVADNALAFMSRIKTMNLMAPEYEMSLEEDEKVRAASAAAEWYATLAPKDIEALGGLTENTAVKMASEYALAQKLYAYIIRDLDPEISDDEARRVTVRYIKLPIVTEEDADSSRSGQIDANTTDNISEQHSAGVTSDQTGIDTTSGQMGTGVSADTRKRLVNRASMIRDEWAAGRGFDELAAEYGGAGEGEWTFGRGEVDIAIENAAYALAEGEVSIPVETDDAVYLLYLISAGNREETRANKEQIADRRKLEVFGETYDTFAESSARHLDDDLYDALKQENVSISAEPFYKTMDNYKLIIN